MHSLEEPQNCQRLKIVKKRAYFKADWEEITERKKLTLICASCWKCLDRDLRMVPRLASCPCPPLKGFAWERDFGDDGAAEMKDEISGRI
jgi:hypothetical protein